MRCRSLRTLGAGCVLVLLCLCAVPPAPHLSEANFVTISFRVNHPAQMIDSLAWKVDDTVRFDVCVRFLSAVDSVEVTSDELKDTTIRLDSAQSDSVFTIARIWTAPGAKTVTGTAFLNDGTEKQAALVFSIGRPPLLGNGGNLLFPLTSAPGDPVVLRVSATGSDTLRYQWLKNSSPLAGRTSDTLAIAALSPADTGLYAAIVRNRWGVDTTNPCHLVFAADTSHPVAGDTNLTIRLVSPAHDSSIVHDSSAQVQVVVKGVSRVTRVRFSVGTDSFPTTALYDSLYSATITHLKLDLFTFVHVNAWDSLGHTVDLVFAIKYIATSVVDSNPTIRLLSPARDSTTVYDSSTQVQIIAKSRASTIARVRFSVGTDTFPVAVFDDSIYYTTITRLKLDQFTQVRVKAWDAAGRTADFAFVIRYTVVPFVFGISSLTLINDSAVVDTGALTVIGSLRRTGAVITSVIARVNLKPATVTGTAAWSFGVKLDTAKWNQIAVTATDDKGQDSTRIFYLFYKPRLGVPAKPTFSGAATSAVTVHWRSVVYCARYLVYRSIHDNSGVHPETVVSNSPDTTCRDTGLLAGSWYAYRIRGYYLIPGRTQGDTTAYSPVDSVRITTSVFQKACGSADDQTVQCMRIAQDSTYVMLSKQSGNEPGSFLLKIGQRGDSVWCKKITGSLVTPMMFQQTADKGFALFGNCSPTGMPQAGMIKVDAAVSFQWEKYYGSDVVYGVYGQQTVDGGYIVLGKDNNTGIAYGDLYRTNSAGVQSWAKKIGSNSFVYDIEQTRDRGYVIAGSQKEGGVSIYDLYITKTDTSGTAAWSHTYTGASNAFSVRQTSDNGYIACGITRGTHTGMYLLRVDSTGTTQWGNVYAGGGTTADDTGTCAVQTSDGGFIACGYTRAMGAGGSDVYLLRTDGAGNKLWEKTFGGTGNDYACTVAQTPDGGFIIGGTTRSYGAAGGGNYYIIKTDKDGNTGPAPQ